MLVFYAASLLLCMHLASGAVVPQDQPSAALEIQKYDSTPDSSPKLQANERKVLATHDARQVQAERVQFVASLRVPVVFWADLARNYNASPSCSNDTITIRNIPSQITCDIAIAGLVMVFQHTDHELLSRCPLLAPPVEAQQAGHALGSTAWATIFREIEEAVVDIDGDIVARTRLVSATEVVSVIDEVISVAHTTSPM